MVIHEVPCHKPMVKITQEVERKEGRDCGSTLACRGKEKTGKGHQLHRYVF